MPDDDEPDVEERLGRLEVRFRQLTDDFTNLRYELNALEEKLERRT